MTKAEKVASEGYDSLSASHKKQIEKAFEIVEKQAQALDESRDAVNKLNEGAKLTRRDNLVLLQVTGLNQDEINELHAADPMPERIARYFKTPEAFFYVSYDDSSVLKVLITHGKKEVDLIPDSDPSYT